MLTGQLLLYALPFVLRVFKYFYSLPQQMEVFHALGFSFTTT